MAVRLLASLLWPVGGALVMSRSTCRSVRYPAGGCEDRGGGEDAYGPATFLAWTVSRGRRVPDPGPVPRQGWRAPVGGMGTTEHLSPTRQCCVPWVIGRQGDAFSCARWPSQVGRSTSTSLVGVPSRSQRSSYPCQMTTSILAWLKPALRFPPVRKDLCANSDARSTWRQRHGRGVRRSSSVPKETSARVQRRTTHAGTPRLAE